MSKFLYKTRNGANNAKLPKVWLCAHPKDISTFLQNDANKILSIVNCAIWYDENSADNYNEEELIDNLSGMNLFVVPVTHRFLIEDNRALSIELPYAMKNNIPILPIIKDSALTNLFNEKCGYIQYLSLESDDDVFSSDEKLKKHISSILLGDETIRKIRDAFDAYIFLSYRKKDKKYANQLMKLIHKNEFCRDIAIWYDEFLTPGENFNEEILKILTKSHIFALAVTPNILEDDNYILTQEYPLATKMGLCILPAEMVKTNEKELRIKYPNIPEITNAYDNNCLSPALLKALSNIAIRTNDNDPTHNFFIGLAYLEGIDVEVDRNRALELIEESSSNGLLEATMKLIDMYRYGDGVERNFDIAISMAERLISQAKDIYLKDDTIDNYKQYINSFNILTTLLIEQGQYKKAIEVCDFNYLIIKESLNKFNKDINMDYFNVLIKKGWYLYQMKDFEGAKKCYEEYLLKAPSYLENNFTILEVNQIRISIELISVLFYIGDFVSANKLLLEIEGRIYKITDEIVEEGIILQISKSYYSLANLMKRKKQYEKALEYYNKSNECYLRVKNSISVEEQLNNESLYYASVADTLYIMNEIDEAQKNYDIAHNLAKEYYQKTGHLRAKEKMATSFFNKANVSMMKSEFDKAKEHLKIALIKFKEIIEQCNSFYSISKQDLILSKLSIIAEQENSMEEAINYTINRINFLEANLERRNDVTYCYMLGNAYSNYALLLNKLHQTQNTYNASKKASKYFEKACKKSDTMIIYAARSYKLEGDYAIKLGLFEEANKAYEKSFDYYMQCVGQKEDTLDVIYLCEVLSKEATDEDLFGFYNVELRCYHRLIKDNPNDETLTSKRRVLQLKCDELWSQLKENEEKDSIDEELVKSVFDED